jgi:hypothetical protein
MFDEDVRTRGQCARTSGVPYPDVSFKEGSTGEQQYLIDMGGSPKADGSCLEVANAASSEAAGASRQHRWSCDGLEGCTFHHFPAPSVTGQLRLPSHGRSDKAHSCKELSIRLEVPGYQHGGKTSISKRVHLQTNE